MTDLDKHITAVARALRERQAALEIHDIGAGTGPYEVREGDGGPLFTGTVEECSDWIDKQYARAAIQEYLRQIRNPGAEAIEVFYRAFEHQLSEARWEAHFSNGLEAFCDHLIAEIADDDK